MKKLLAILLIVLVAGTADSSAVMMGIGSEREPRSTITIRSDGTCLAVTEAIQQRAMAEQQLKMMERFTLMQEGADEESDAADTPDAPDAPESATASERLTNEELAKRLRAIYDDIAEREGQDISQQTMNIEVTEEIVSVRTERTFSSIEDMLRNGRYIWSSGVVTFDRIRAEETNGVLRLTLSTTRGAQRYLRVPRAQLKMIHAGGELKVVLPGKVLASGLPETATNATWLTVDTQKEESLDAAIKLYDQPVVIEAELGGLKLPRPLDSSVLRRALAGGDVEPDLPVTDAGPGFTTEAVGLTVTSLHVFPEGEKFVKGTMTHSLQPTGVIVKVKFFAPKGRSILSTEPARVLKAVDDQGRSMAAVGSDEDSDEDISIVRHSHFLGGEQSQSTTLDLRLPIPALDAKAIDEVAVEMIAVTAGSWKEMTIPTVNAGSTNEIDLETVLPGAKLVITKFTPQQGRVAIEARLTGPRAVLRLEVKATIPGRRNFSSHASNRRSNVSGETATRAISIQGYDYRGSGESGELSEVSLSVRFPEDIKRERVQFTLKGLDLL